MKQRVLNYMLEFGSITQYEANRDLGCSRLSEYIRQLRQVMIIDDIQEKGVNRWGTKTKWKRYFIRGENNGI